MLRSVCIQERRQGHSSTRSIVKSFQNKRRILREARVKWCTKARKKKKRGSRTVIITCSSVSRCQFESDRTARTLGVRPSLSVQRGERTAFGWSAGKRTRSPTSAPPTCFQTPEIEADKTSARSGIDIRALGKSEKRG